jgi:3-oxoacyl-[acyl-carrier protein] reductase
MAEQARTALVTGGTRGIGRGIVDRLAAGGYDVAFSGRDQHAGAAAESQLRERGLSAVFLPADLTDPSAVARLVDEAVSTLGALKVLCHAAGIYPEQRLADMSTDDWHSVLDTNLTSAFLLVKHAAPHLAASGSGRIVFISSITGPRTGISGLAHYSASKGGLDGLMRAAAMELAPDITTNAVAPGTILTDSLAELYAEPGVIDSVTSIIPARRMGTPADIAAAVEFLAGPDSGFITGQSIIVDGGQTLPEVQGAS